MRGGCAPARRSRAIMARPPSSGLRATFPTGKAYHNMKGGSRPCCIYSTHLRCCFCSAGPVRFWRSSLPSPRLAAAAGIERRGGRAVSLRGRGFPARWRCGCTAGAGRRVGRRACAIPPLRVAAAWKKAASVPGFTLFLGGAAFIWLLFCVQQPMFTQWDEFTAWGLAPRWSWSAAHSMWPTRST